LPQRSQIQTPDGLFAFDLLQQLRVSRDKRDVVRIEKQLELQILKLMAMSVSQGLKDGRNVDGEKELVRYLVWETKYWNDNLRKEFVVNMKASWKIFCEVNPHIVKTMSVRRVDTRKVVEKKK
jgi:hypothetical protein